MGQILCGSTFPKQVETGLSDVLVLFRVGGYRIDRDFGKAEQDRIDIEVNPFRIGTSGKTCCDDCPCIVDHGFAFLSALRGYPIRNLELSDSLSSRRIGQSPIHQTVPHAS